VRWRYDLILEPAQEQDGNVGDLWHHFFARPNLMTQRCQVLRCGDYTWNHLLDAEESVFKYQASDIASILVLDSKSNADSTSQTLAVDDNFCLLEIISTSNIVKSSLRVDCDALFVWVTRRQAVSSILKHQDIAIQVVRQNLSNWKSMTNVSSVSMEHEESDILCLADVSWLDEECTQVFTIWCR